MQLDLDAPTQMTLCKILRFAIRRAGIEYTHAKTEEDAATWQNFWKEAVAAEKAFTAAVTATEKVENETPPESHPENV